MNRADAFTAERKRIEEQLGYYVPLEDAANMMKTAQKVVSVVNSYSYSVSYQEYSIDWIKSNLDEFAELVGVPVIEVKEDE